MCALCSSLKLLAEWWIFGCDADKATSTLPSKRRATSARLTSRRHLSGSDVGTRGPGCCFNVGRYCLCAIKTQRRQSHGAVSAEVMLDHCVFSRASVNAALVISGPSAVERNKMSRYQHCRQHNVGGGTSAQTRPHSAAPRLTSTSRADHPQPAVSHGIVSPVTKPPPSENHGSDHVARLYRTYAYQFTTSYRAPVSQHALHASSPPTSRPPVAPGDPSEDDAATTTMSGVVPVVLGAREASAMGSIASRRGGAEHRASSRRSPTTSQRAHH